MKTIKVHEDSFLVQCDKCDTEQRKVVTERIEADDGTVLGVKGYYKCQCGVAPFAYGMCTGDIQRVLFPMKLSVQDMEFHELTKRVREELVKCMGIPKLLIKKEEPNARNNI